MIFDDSLDVTSYSEVVFTLKSCTTGFISLSSSPVFPQDELQAYEVQVSQIDTHLYACHNCASNSQLDYSAVINDPAFQCLSQPRTFWLAWDDDTVVMGEGSQPLSNPLLWREPLLHTIDYLGFASPYANSVTEWNLTSCEHDSNPVSEPSLTTVEFNSTFTTTKTTVTHILDVSGVTALTQTTHTCYTVFVDAADKIDEIIGDHLTNPVINMQITWSIINVQRSYPYQLLSSSIPSFGAGFNCYTDEMTLWITMQGGFLAMGVGSDVTTNELFEVELDGLQLNHFGFRATAQDTPSWTINNLLASSTTTPVTVTATTATVIPTSTPSTVTTAARAQLQIWHKQDVSVTASNNYVISESVTERSDISCGRQRLQRVWCSAFNYDPVSKGCNLLQKITAPVNSSVSLISSIFEMI